MTNPKFFLAYFDPKSEGRQEREERLAAEKVVSENVNGKGKGKGNGNGNEEGNGKKTGDDEVVIISSA